MSQKRSVIFGKIHLRTNRRLVKAKRLQFLHNVISPTLLQIRLSVS